MVTKKYLSNQGGAGVSADTGWFEAEPGVKFKVLVPTEQTDGLYACLESIAQKGTGSTFHIHHKEDEHFLILEGAGHFALGDKKFDVHAGNSISLPRGIPHAWSNKGDIPLRALIVFSPGGFDRLCMEMISSVGLDKSDIRKRFGLEVIGPKL